MIARCALPRGRGSGVPQVCTICTHDQRLEIDQALVSGAPNRRIAARYHVTEQAIRRHKDTHIPSTLAEAQAAHDTAHADDLLSQVHDLQRRTLVLLAKAEKEDKLALALAAIRESRGNLELLAKLEGKLREQQTTNIIIAPQWLELRTVIIGALAPYPEARAAVAAALEVQS
jgi:hypothetical protein